MFAATKNFAPALAVGAAPPPPPAALTLGLRHRVSGGKALDAAEQAAGHSLLQGTLSLAQVREGFYLHRTDVVHVQDMTSRFPLSKAGVKIVLKLQGSGSLRIGHLALPLALGARAAPRGAVVSLREPALYEHCCRAASRERMLVITLMPDWLASAGLGYLNAAAHLSMAAWQPSPRALCIAQQLLHSPAPAGDPLRGLHQECRALELAAEALGHWPPPNSAADVPPPEASALRPAQYQRARRLRDWLDSGQADALRMADIARHMGCNTSTLQTEFRQAFGKPIFDHLRESRLRRAADAISTQGLSIAQAAQLAGYGSQANFATAFRKLYGFAPKALRR